MKNKSVRFNNRKFFIGVLKQVWVDELEGFDKLYPQLYLLKIIDFTSKLYFENIFFRNKANFAVVS